ncbi:unnamed protein product [Danaus chrysippus]|uniref:(African queen) hypothetical protein n=1 Tax=Danaus chrysippus TaxID=151541 RepID=A0A8J2WA02_9NEOP|nr:unnamed protein product [Danaus chrysippus]
MSDLSFVNIGQQSLKLGDGVETSSKDVGPIVDRPTFFTSKIGARIMKLRGYWYTRHSVCSSRVKWLCAESRHKQCHAIVVTIGCMTVDRQNKHTHPPLLNASRQTDVDFLQLLDSNNRLMSS